jgi:hypothetical protein
MKARVCGGATLKLTATALPWRYEYPAGATQFWTLAVAVVCVDRPPGQGEHLRLLPPGLLGKEGAARGE